MGRGGRSNNNPGNKLFHADKARLQETYVGSPKKMKRRIAKQLVDLVHSRNGRFLQWDKRSGKWLEVSEKKAIDKASQALRSRSVSKSL